MEHQPQPLTEQQLSDAYDAEVFARSAAKTRKEVRIASTAALVCFAVFGAGVVYELATDNDSVPVTADTYSPDVTPSSLPEQPAEYTANPIICNPANFTAPDAVRNKKNATACTDMMDNGRIAMVNFDAPQATGKDLGESIIQQLAVVTGGRVRPKLTTLQASPEAKEALQDTLNGSACIDHKFPEKYASAAADKTMDLEKYDLVIGLTDKEACDSTILKQIGGSASDDGRHIDLFKINALGRSPKNIMRASGVHETLHQYGMSHAGEINGRIGSSHYLDLSQYLAKNRNGRTIALDAYLSEPEYNEYESSQIMGNSSYKHMGPMNGPQRNCLLAADRALGRKHSQLKRAIGNDPTTITSKQAAKGQYAAAELNEPIMITSSDSKKRGVFDHVAVVPRTVQTGGSSTAIEAFDVMLVGEDTCRVARLGEVGSTEGGVESWKLQTGSRTISIKLGRGALTLTPTS